MSDDASVRSSPMKRMRSLRFSKKRNTIKRDEISATPPTSPEKLEPGASESAPSVVTLDTGNAKWARNPDVIDKMLGNMKKELSPNELNNLSGSLSGQEVKSALTKNNKSPGRDLSPVPTRSQPRSKSKTHNTKSSRFPIKISRKSDTDKAHFQQIDLRQIEICQRIGCGASSAGVFLCLVDGWACAMKQLHREHVGAIDIRCFEREMDILYQLPPHPCIVRYLFHTTQGSDLCLFMQLYSGTLREHLDERRKSNDLLPPEMIARIALDAAQGIQFLHQHKVIHRDIKAGNIFITKNEHDEITRIAIGDFDTSLRVSASLRNLKKDADDIISHDSPASDPTMLRNANGHRNLNTAEKRNYFASNRPRSTVGTTGFMAPEVLRSRGSTPYGFKADIYSFGMLLYEMLTLKLPFEQLETVEIIDAKLHGENVDSMRIDPLIKEQYRSLVDLYRMATNATPEQRPSIDKIINVLLPMVSDGHDFLAKVERKPSLVDQLNKLTGSAPANTLAEPDLGMEMENDIMKANGVSPDSKVKFGGPQTVLALSPRHLDDPDAVSHLEEDESEFDSKAEDESSHKKRGKFSRTVSRITRGDKIKRKKDKKEEDEKKKSRRLARTPRKSTENAMNVSPSLPATGTGTGTATDDLDDEVSSSSHKRPKRNTISKTTLQRMVNAQDEVDPNPVNPQLVLGQKQNL